MGKEQTIGWGGKEARTIKSAGGHYYCKRVIMGSAVRGLKRKRWTPGIPRKIGMLEGGGQKNESDRTHGHNGNQKEKTTKLRGGQK